MHKFFACLHQKKSFFADPLGALLIAMNSLLLGIWVLKGTIALRNILLIIGFLLAVLYIARLFIEHLWHPSSYHFRFWLPNLLILALFIWIIFHYLFLSMNPVTQLQELRSTWFRGFLAWVMGSVCAMAILQNPTRISWLALGLLSNFVGLIFEYVPLAIGQGKLSSLMVVYENYLQGKIYAVLLGVVYLGALLGLISKKIEGKADESWRVILYWFSCLIPIFYSYIFIVDTRNGIGLSALLFSCWIFWAVVYLYKNFSHIRRHFSIGKTVAILFILTTLIVGAIRLQANQNKDWGATIQDALIAIQIEKYPNWQNPPALGYPAEVKAANTYERAAWFVAAASVIPNRVWGDGTLKHAFGRAIKEQYPQSNLTTSHSPWLDFTLSLGVPGLVFLLGAFLMTLVMSIRVKGLFIHYVRWVTLAILFTYSIAELFNQAAFEILLYFSGLLPCLLLSEVFIRKTRVS